MPEATTGIHADADADICAAVSNDHLRVTLRAAPPLALHPADLPRTDGNSPVLGDGEGVMAFFSHYLPAGHSYRRRGGARLDFDQPALPVRFAGDPDPATGKWIEAVWRGPDGRLVALYHAEVLAPCPERLYLPQIGMAASDDNGLTWRLDGPALRAPAAQTDCGYRNGFFAGGFGDLCALPDRTGSFVYMAFTSFVAAEPAQGVVMARFPFAAGTAGLAELELWTGAGWQRASPAGDMLPQPLWPMGRGWRHLDPDGFWGPAIHYNHDLDAYVMLLNHTAGGFGNLLQEGIYVSVNAGLGNPAGWSAPLRLVAGGAWYPQAVGLQPGGGDTRVAGAARFFMAGYSAWTVSFAPADGTAIVDQPLTPTKAMFAALFGTAHKPPW